MKNKLLCYIFLFIFPVTLNGQIRWTLDSCMVYAVEKNLKLQNKRIETRMEKKNHLEALGRFLPFAETNVKWGRRFGRSVNPQNNLYTSSSFNEGSMGVNVSIPVFQGFVRLNYAKFTRLNKQISQWNNKVEENRIAYDVMDAFYQVLFNEQMLSISYEQRRLSEKYQMQMEEFVKLGMRSEMDLQEVRSRLQSDIYQQTVRKNSYKTAVLHLKQLMNIRESDSLEIRYDEQKDVIPLLEHISQGEFYQQSESVLPQFQSMDLRCRSVLLQRKIKAGAYSPVISAEFGLSSIYYNTDKDDNGIMIPIREQFKNNLGKYVGLSVSFPIFTGLSRFTDIRKENLRIRMIENEREQLRQDIISEIENAGLSLRAAVDEYHKAITQADFSKQILRRSEEQWEEGLISVFELMEKRNLYISSQAELFRTKIQYELQRRIIEYYRTGTFLNQEE